MTTEKKSSLTMLLHTLTDAELHDLLVTVQTELLNRPDHQDGRAVEVVTAEEAALLALYRSVPPGHQQRLHTLVSRAVLPPTADH